MELNHFSRSDLAEQPSMQRDAYTPDGTGDR